MATEQIPDGVI